MLEVIEFCFEFAVEIEIRLVLFIKADGVVCSISLVCSRARRLTHRIEAEILADVTSHIAQRESICPLDKLHGRGLKVFMPLDENNNSFGDLPKVEIDLISDDAEIGSWKPDADKQIN